MSDPIPASAELIQSITAVVSMFAGVGAFLLAIATYVAMSIGLYCMSKSCGLSHGWISFIPYAQSFRIGQIADHQCEINEHKHSTYRHKLLILHILLAAASAIFEAVVSYTFMESLMEKALNGTLEALMKDPRFLSQELSAAQSEAWLLNLIVTAITIVNLVFCCMAMHKMAKLYLPNIAGLAVVLYLFVPLSQPVLYIIMGLRKPQYENPSPRFDGEDNTFYTL